MLNGAKRKMATTCRLARRRLIVGALILCVHPIFVRSNEIGLESGSKVRDRIDVVVQNEMAKAKEAALKKAIDAEFEIADADDSGTIDRSEFQSYLVREDQFSLASTGQGGSRRQRSGRVGGQIEQEGKWLGSTEKQGKLPRTGRPIIQKPNTGGRKGVPPTFPAGAFEKQGQQDLDGENTQGLEESEKTDTGFFSAFWSAVLMIIVTELGDKTFFIAMLLALKHPRLVVYTGSVGALVAMTVISAAIGGVLPSLLPKKYTTLLAGLLFLYFGVKMLMEAREHYISPPEKNEELEEAEEEINSFGKKDELPSPGGPSSSSSPMRGKRARDLQIRILTQSFVMTFLAEWGDRSQIATIAMATKSNPYGITLGGCIGHAMCTGLAVIGGQLLSKHVSEKEILLVGGVVFLLFAIHSFLVGPE